MSRKQPPRAVRARKKRPPVEEAEERVFRRTLQVNQQVVEATSRCRRAPLMSSRPVRTGRSASAASGSPPSDPQSKRNRTSSLPRTPS